MRLMQWHVAINKSSRDPFDGEEECLSLRLVRTIDHDVPDKLTQVRQTSREAKILLAFSVLV
jgi:hypothetical protein